MQATLSFRYKIRVGKAVGFYCLFLFIHIFLAITCELQQKHEVPQNFRRALSSNVRRLTAQKKLEKVKEFWILDFLVKVLQ